MQHKIYKVDNHQWPQSNVNSHEFIQGQLFTTSTAAGPSKQSTKPTMSHRAYEVAEFYRKRKEFQLNKIKAEEERMRKHKAKPMPNFKAMHSKAAMAPKPKTVEECVCPVTPEVLRRGILMKEKQKQKVHSKHFRFLSKILKFNLFQIKEHELKLAERPQLVAKSSRVLMENPFKPKLEPHRPLKVEPFKLQMDERLEQRRMYDEKYQRELAIKKQKVSWLSTQSDRLSAFDIPSSHTLQVSFRKMQFTSKFR